MRVCSLHSRVCNPWQSLGSVTQCVVSTAECAIHSKVRNPRQSVQSMAGCTISTAKCAAHSRVCNRLQSMQFLVAKCAIHSIVCYLQHSPTLFVCVHVRTHLNSSSRAHVRHVAGCAHVCVTHRCASTDWLASAKVTTTTTTTTTSSRK